MTAYYSNDEISMAATNSQRYAPGREIKRLGNLEIHKGGISASHMMEKMSKPQGFDKLWQQQQQNPEGPRPPPGVGGGPPPPKESPHVHDFFGKYSKTMKNQILAHQAVYGDGS